MKRVDIVTQEIQKLLEPFIGKVKVKTYFSYYALFKDDHMFALYKDGKFYLKESDILKQEICVILGVDHPVTILNNHYYFIPLSILYDFDPYKHWVIAVLDTLEEIAAVRLANRKQQIRFLPNMNVHWERVLYRHGIETKDQLIEMGASQVFVILVKQGLPAQYSLLFKLYGAIQHKLTCILTLAEKNQLIDETNENLRNAGLRYRLSNIKDNY